jgi:hypothetical protein
LLGLILCHPTPYGEAQASIAKCPKLKILLC